MVTAETVLKAQQGDYETQQRLMKMFYRIAGEEALKIFPYAQNLEDIKQDAMMHLWAGIKNFKPGFKMKPINFLYTCLKCGLAIHYRHQMTQKEKMNYYAASIDRPVAHDSDDTYKDSLKDNQNFSEEVVNKLEFQQWFDDFSQVLTPLEKRVLELKYMDCPPKVACKILNITPKQENNAWIRVQKKARARGH